MLLSECGHVVCVVCEEKLVKVDKACPVCSRRVRDKDIIRLQVREGE